MLKNIINSAIALFIMGAIFFLFFWKDVRKHLVVASVTELTKPSVINDIILSAVNDPESWFNKKK